LEKQVEYLRGARLNLQWQCRLPGFDLLISLTGVDAVTMAGVSPTRSMKASAASRYLVSATPQKSRQK
jgi:hypothetical protein